MTIKTIKEQLESLDIDFIIKKPNAKNYIKLLEDREKGLSQIMMSQQKEIEKLRKENEELKEFIRPCLNVNTSDEFEMASIFESFINEAEKLLN